MARVTVEDCILKVPNRFDLVMLAAQRARDVASGAQLTVERDNDKNPVVALREIADETTPLENLAESLVQGMRKHVEVDEPEEDAPEFDVPSIPGVSAGSGEAPVTELEGQVEPAASDAEEMDVETADEEPMAAGEDGGAALEAGAVAAAAPGDEDEV